MQESTTKKCSKCGDTKPFDCFYKNKATKTGLTSYCKLCVKACQNSEKRRAAQKAYNHSDKGRAAQKAHRNSAKGKTTKKAYRSSAKYKASQKVYQNSENGKAAQKAYKTANPIKVAAKEAIARAIAAGRISKPNNCTRCGEVPSQLDGHHNDYAKPLEVRWLCPSCHKGWHKQNGPGLNGVSLN